MLCDYGCGKQAKYILKNNKNCCSAHYSSCEAVRKKNSKSLVKAHSDGRVPGWNELSKTTSLNRGWRKGKYSTTNEMIFKENSSHSTDYIKGRILKENLIEYVCDCGITDIWRDKKIVLELDHRNGVRNDNRLENLRFLCPNCHSQTDTFRGRNNKNNHKVSDIDLLENYKKSKNIRQTLISVGLAPKGGNYSRLKKLIDKNSAGVRK